MSDRQRLLDLIQRHGWNAMAFQTLESGYVYFFLGADACVPYIETRSAWVAAGAPIAAPDRIGDVADAFADAARRAGKRCCFLGTEARFHERAGTEWRALAIGEQPVWDPRAWPAMLAGHRSLREQLRRARAKGVRVRALGDDELEAGPTRDAIEHITSRWLATKTMAPMDFLVRVEPFHFPAHRRCFVAELDGRLVGFAGVVPVPAREGWFIEDLVRSPDAPNGTGELLTDAVMRWAADAGCSWLTLGLAPLAGDVSAPLRVVRRGGRFLYDFRGLRRYKAKLRPASWHTIFLSFPRAQSPALSIVDALAAFARGGFLRFGVRSLLRGPTAMIRALAALLLPWTIGLGMMPTVAWFGAPWIKWGWFYFDAALAVALFRFLRHPSSRLAAVLAGAVTIDAALTVVQAIIWNLPRASGWFDHVVIAAACAAPAFAAVLLLGAHARLQRLAPQSNS